MRIPTMLFWVVTLLFFAACSNTSRNIVSKDGDVPLGGDEMVTDGDSLLTDESVGDDTTSPDAKEEGIPKDDAVFVENESVITDDVSLITDKDEVVSDEALPDETETDANLPDETLPDNDTFVGFCGDGIVSGAEACDDGESNGTYGHCKNDCTGLGPHCGDGVVNVGYEICDDGIYNGTYGHCNDSCSGEASYCGDGVTDIGYELCDDGSDNGTYGHCKSDCTGLGPHCGDGTVDSPYEKCDDGADNGTYSHCKSDCSGLGSYCGDGKVDTPYEECDKSKDQYCVGDPGGGCGGQQYRIRKCNNTTCTWGAWSNCGYSDGQDAENFGTCPPGYEC